MSLDPFHLDQTSYAQEIRVQQRDRKFADVLLASLHPLLSTPNVAQAYAYLQEIQEHLLRERNPGSTPQEDAYFEFKEGMVLRQEVVVKIVLDYVRGCRTLIPES